MAVFIMLAAILYTVVGVSLDDMYPYPLSNITAGPDDQLLPATLDGSSSAINFSFPFFNMSFDAIFVNNNGHLSFIRPVSLYSPKPFPLRTITLIAPFWMDVDTRQTGQVWYKLSSFSELLSRAQVDVSTFFLNQSTFQPTKVFTATWVDVPCWSATGDDLTKRNTFQIVLVTDGATSFAMFHYQKIEWAGYADNVTKAVVGFNAGDGVNSYTVNSSDYNDVINLVNRSNTGIAGKFIYRVDGDAIIEPASDEISTA